MGSQLHPLYALFAVLGLATGLWTIHQRAPQATLWLLAASGAGLVVRAVALASRGRGDGSGRAVDHRALRRKDFRRYKAWLKENVRGQDSAVERVVAAIQRGLELSQPGRGLASFLLVGPTGTGKTFLAQMVAKVLTPDVEPVLLRMNQYNSPDDVAQLLGTPGPAGLGLTGALSGPVLELPHRVVILDEADKCHPEVRHALLDALDAGRCRDRCTGQAVDFSGCVFFATANAGADGLRALADAPPESVVGKARDILAREAGFDKAFLARFGEVLLLDKLGPHSVAEIACLQIAKVWRGQGVEPTFISPELLAFAVRRNEEFGEYGVRQLAHCLRRLTDGALEEARRRGLSRARLGLDEAAEAASLEDA